MREGAGVARNGRGGTEPQACATAALPGAEVLALTVGAASHEAAPKLCFVRRAPYASGLGGGHKKLSSAIIHNGCNGRVAWFACLRELAVR
jgi:hypothetical protein